MMLHRERMRADRTAQQMSLVVFEVGSQTPRCVRRLTRALEELSRATDEVGWFDEKRPCAILPATAASGAERFARRISELAHGAPNVRWSVYSYPDSRPPHDDRGGPPDQEDPGSDPPRPGGRRVRRMAMGGSGLSSDESVAVAVLETRSLENDPLLPRVRAMPVDPLLLDPLPQWKRIMDIIGAIVGLIVFLPLMLLIAATIKLTSRGPVLFKQRRAGLGNRPFTIYKFRTMSVDAEARQAELRPLSQQDGPAFKMAHDPRTTRIGRFLRKTSLDELPQFWNVLMGDMSLVGPRPLPLDEAAECLPWQQQRLLVMPGLTCIWQVRGRSEVQFDEWMRMDMAYIRRRSFLFDVWLLLLTVWAVVLRRGAH